MYGYSVVITRDHYEYITVISHRTELWSYHGLDNLLVMDGFWFTMIGQILVLSNIAYQLFMRVLR
jgi:hypothetical protein